MATTELHKLPDTILSRCQEFEFRTIPLTKIFDCLKIIADAEKIDIAEKALREIARTGEGSMRDAQSNFDQVISFSGEKIDVSDVSLALGIAGAEMLTRTARAIAENNPAEALKIVDNLIVSGQDLRNFCRDLLSFFRDLLVYKMAGDAENLLDTAVLSRDELENNSQPFTEADLIRFFNSLSETESKLREATQPRYVLEIGLVKIIEMRRVTPIEKLLERLARLESAIGSGNFSTENVGTETAASPTSEKKTLTIDFSPDESPFPVSPRTVPAQSAVISDELAPTNSQIEESAAETISATETVPEIQTPPVPPPDESLSNSLRMIESMPVKLPPIDAEELEHIEDAWLDDAYDRKLQISGDDLSPLPNAANFVEILLGEHTLQAVSATIETFNGGAATATAPAKSPVVFVPPGYEDEISEEIPVLPENPSDAEMWKYAENHPLVKKALRIFRGKIIEVKKFGT